VILCPACGKLNQGHFKFCLGCGAELPYNESDEVTQSGVARDLTRSGVANDLMRMAEAAAGAGELEAEADPPTNRKPPGTRAARNCSKCGAPNEPTHHFCASCGNNLTTGRPSPHIAGTPGARLTALNPDGSEGNIIPLTGATTVGRATGGIFAADQYLSPQHASFAPKTDHVMVTDASSLNGVFRKLAADQRYQLRAGQVFRIGQELIRFETLQPKGNDNHGVEHMGAPIEGYVGRIAMVLGRNTTGTAFPIPETGLNLGRERGEVLFSDDGYVSGLHCRLSFDTGRVYLTDLGSSNGTFVKVIGSEHFANGEVLLMGQQLFRVTV
jgi:pSer/pThr/pTyr-binding forkhead associated (FHA) protein